MTRLVLLTLLLATLVGCAGSLKYERSKRLQYIPCIEMDSVIVTPEVSNVEPMLELCGSDRR
jgi:hypothetical protein